MIERVFLVFALATLVALAVLLVRFVALARTLRAAKSLRGGGAWTALGAAPDGRRAVVQFSTASCAACHTAQAPAIARAARELGADSLRVIEVDAARQPAIAQAFGVLTVPSTVVLDAAGEVRAVNQGFAPTARLVQQLRSA